jgi:broad specificity phosphatase PhoE
MDPVKHLDTDFMLVADHPYLQVCPGMDDGVGRQLARDQRELIETLLLEPSDPAERGHDELPGQPGAFRYRGQPHDERLSRAGPHPKLCGHGRMIPICGQIETPSGENATMSPLPGPDLLIIRHGETTWSMSGRHTSRTDLPLTSRGEAEARALGPRLAERSWSLVLTSPMRRAERTAELAGLPDAVVDADLMEWDYGDYEGLTTAEIRALVPGWSIWSGPWPGGETPIEVAARADRVVARVRSCPPGTTVAAVAHAHLLRVLAARWLEARPEDGARYALSAASVSQLGWEHETAVIQLWNDRSHLHAEGG